MKKIILSILLVLLYKIVFSQTEYEIQIKQSGLLLVGNTTWQIRNKELFFERENYDKPDDTFHKSFSELEMQTIYELASKIDIENNKKDTVQNPPDDIGEYNFAITINNQFKQFDLYQVKVNEVFELVKYINSLLSINYQIGYDDNYFRYLNYKN